MSVITIENEFIRAMLNTKAGYIESIVRKKDGSEHAWQYDSSVWPRRTAVCFPLCGKSRDDSYTFEGRKYDMPNHGFLRERELSVILSDDTHLVLEDRWDDETLLRYPFRYSYRIGYSLDGENFNISYEVKNEDERTMYYSTGSHYTYALPLNQEKCFLHFSSPQSAGSFSQNDGLLHDDRLLGRRCIPLKGLIDSESLILDIDTLKTEWIGLGDEDSPFTKVSGKGFRYLIIWAPAGGRNDFTCIEFWDGTGQVETYSDDIEKRFAIRKLESGKSRSYLQTVSF